jgi:hypothetical protein
VEIIGPKAESCLGRSFAAPTTTNLDCSRYFRKFSESSVSWDGNESLHIHLSTLSTVATCWRLLAAIVIPKAGNVRYDKFDGRKGLVNATN